MAQVPVSKTVHRFTGSLSPLISDRWERFVVLLEGLYGVQLPRLPLIGNEQLKKFCSGLIEGDGKHLWQPVVRRLSARSRFGFAHSLFLFRKVIPQEKPRVEDFVRRYGEPQPPPDPHFLSFAKKLTRSLFHPGWDSTYVGRCLTSSLPTTACAEVGRLDGGCREFGFGNEFNILSVQDDRAEFCSYVMEAVSPRHRGASRVQSVLSGGKWRIISIPPGVDNALRPLHHAMYSHLSRFPWLLRGDAKPSRFKDFSRKEGEIFVSGDYESATDNLNLDLQKAILGELLCSSSCVPQGIKEHVLSTYESQLNVVDRKGNISLSVRQRRGQLMGQLTSFPLLCLVNYITFRYSVPRPVPVRINGDDIVFRATPDETLNWERNVAKGGLTLSLGKTMKSPRCFTLNSTPFWGGRSSAESVGFVRSSALFKPGEIEERVKSLSGRFYSVSHGFGRRRSRLVRTTFLDLNRQPILASRRSLTRGLGLSVDREMLHSVGMWQRELFYLEQLRELPLPQVARGCLPDGWVQVSKHVVPKDLLPIFESEWAWACTDHAWFHRDRPTGVKTSYIDTVREGCSPYGLGTLASAKVRKMLGLSRSELWKWIFRRQNESVFGRVRWSLGEKVWVNVDQQFSRSLVNFVKAQL